MVVRQQLRQPILWRGELRRRWKGETGHLPDWLVRLQLCAALLVRAVGWHPTLKRQPILARPELIGADAEPLHETLTRCDLLRSNLRRVGHGGGANLAARREECAQATGGDGEEGDGERGDEDTDDRVLECGQTRVEDCVEAAEDDEQRGGEQEGKFLPGAGREGGGGGELDDGRRWKTGCRSMYVVPSATKLVTGTHVPVPWMAREGSGLSGAHELILKLVLVGESTSLQSRREEEQEDGGGMHPDDQMMTGVAASRIWEKGEMGAQLVHRLPLLPLLTYFTTRQHTTHLSSSKRSTSPKRSGVSVVTVRASCRPQITNCQSVTASEVHALNHPSSASASACRMRSRIVSHGGGYRTPRR